MRVLKRSGEFENVSFDKVLRRITSACEYSPQITSIDPTVIAQQVCTRIYDGVTTRELDELTCEICVGEVVDNLDYNTLATRIAISNHHKSTPEHFMYAMTRLFENTTNEGISYPLITEELYDLVQHYQDEIQNELDFSRDFLLDYFGFKTLEKSYLIKVRDITVERPQHMFMRVSLGMHYDRKLPPYQQYHNLKQAFQTYHLMSNKYFTHATPTLFNAGTNYPQMSSCYLLAMNDDSIVGIYDTLKETAQISKWGGGIGLHLHNVRGKGSRIHSTNAYSTGIIPMIKVFNATAKYVNQGGRRNGAFALYLEPWHIDIFEFLDLRKNHGNEEERARDIFNALWIPDLFMERVQDDEDWSLFHPNEAKGLYQSYGSAFKQIYCDLEQSGKAVKKIKARRLWQHILDAQIETGTPYILFKDAANTKSNQQHLGTIGSSNLCTEIIEYSDPYETAVCNLASICLPNFIRSPEINATIQKSYQVDDTNAVPLFDVSRYTKGHTSDMATFDFQSLATITKICVRNLNKIIDRNFYPTLNTRRSNFRHRPIGLGVQGLADVYTMMRLPFDSPKASELNEQIFAVMYYAALEASNEIAQERRYSLTKWYAEATNQTMMDTFKKSREELAKKDPILAKQDIHWLWDTEYGNEMITDEEIYAFEENTRNGDHFSGSYSSFKGSPTSKGQLQFDLWNKTPIDVSTLVPGWNWDTLKENIKTYGLRNSLLVAPMPTASTSQIMGNNECFEPFTSNLYVRRTQAGDFILLNKYLFNELSSRGLWTRQLREEIMAQRGSIQHIPIIPDDIKDIYKTVWEIKQKVLMDYSIARGPYICQSQSLNVFMEQAEHSKMTKALFYAWKNGLKTGQYYLRTKPVANAQQFTVNVKQKSQVKTHSTSDEIEHCETCAL